MKNWVLGNWKMNHSLKNIDAFFKPLNDFKPEANVVAGIAPQAMHLHYCQVKCQSQKNLKLGAQNAHFESKGAFTGESSVEAFKELGADFILIGHSERRAQFNESDEFLAQKVMKTIEQNLVAVFCVGETLEQREAGQTWEIIKSQLQGGLGQLKSSDNLVVAYEPVWAIGTGKTATPEQAGEVHSQIRSWLEANLPKNSEPTPILYGGSVKPANFASLLEIKDIAGGLVGGASLQPESFIELCKIAGSNA